MATEHHEYHMLKLAGTFVTIVAAIITVGGASCESYKNYQAGATTRAMVKAGYSPVAIRCGQDAAGDGLSKEDRAKLCTQVVLTEGKHARLYK